MYVTHPGDTMPLMIIMDVYLGSYTLSPYWLIGKSTPLDIPIF